MSKLTSYFAAVLLLLSIAIYAQETTYTAIGRTALTPEIDAWNIDVRPDFEGLPPGSGSVKQGEKIWENQCAACHGTFGDSTDVYRPIIGGTTEKDMETGRSATLASGSPNITTLSKLSTVSTLWDYIHRAMPWNNPKSLSYDEVYAATAYILHLGDIVPYDFELNNDNIEEVQAILPNRYGTERYDSLWYIDGEPDVQNVACMQDCATEVKIISEFPERALEASGNPADQNRPWGAIRGMDIAEEEDVEKEKELADASAAREPSAKDLAQDAGCFACHGIDHKLVGPSFTDIASKYEGDEEDAATRLFKAVKEGSSGVWSGATMPPQQVNDESLKTIIEWILDGADT